jgi:hypothetical protein
MKYKTKNEDVEEVLALFLAIFICGGFILFLIFCVNNIQKFGYIDQETLGQQIQPEKYKCLNNYQDKKVGDLPVYCLQYFNEKI